MTQKNILLVDDSKSARYALRLLLQKQGFEVDMADSAELALEMLKSKKPDAIFMDHMMPGMDGFEATELIKGNPATTHIPVVMCTSNDQDEYVRQAKSMGSLGILPKPATPAKLVEMLGNIQREIEAAQARKKKSARREAAPATGVPSKALEALVLKTTRTILKETVEPLVDKRIISMMNATGDGLKSEIMDAVRDQTRGMVSDASRQVATEVFESRIETHIEQLRQELMEQILDVLRATVTEDPVIKQGIQIVALESATTEAEEVAVEAATASARTVAEQIGDEKVAEATKAIGALSKKINMLAFLAAAVGVAAAAAVYFFR
jgi:CheY-like chemotaxis protein